MGWVGLGFQLKKLSLEKEDNGTITDEAAGSCRDSCLIENSNNGFILGSSDSYHLSAMSDHVPDMIIICIT